MQLFRVLGHISFFPLVHVHPNLNSEGYLIQTEILITAVIFPDIVLFQFPLLTVI